MAYNDFLVSKDVRFSTLHRNGKFRCDEQILKFAFEHLHCNIKPTEITITYFQFHDQEQGLGNVGCSMYWDVQGSNWHHSV